MCTRHIKARSRSTVENLMSPGICPLEKEWLSDTSGEREKKKLYNPLTRRHTFYFFSRGCTRARPRAEFHFPLFPGARGLHFFSERTFSVPGRRSYIYTLLCRPGVFPAIKRVPALAGPGKSVLWRESKGFSLSLLFWHCCVYLSGKSKTRIDDSTHVDRPRHREKVSNPCRTCSIDFFFRNICLGSSILWWDMFCIRIIVFVSELFTVAR